MGVSEYWQLPQRVNFLQLYLVNGQFYLLTIKQSNYFLSFHLNNEQKNTLISCHFFPNNLKFLEIRDIFLSSQQKTINTIINTLEARHFKGLPTCQFSSNVCLRYDNFGFISYFVVQSWRRIPQSLTTTVLYGSPEILGHPRWRGTEVLFERHALKDIFLLYEYTCKTRLPPSRPGGSLEDEVSINKWIKN